MGSVWLPQDAAVSPDIGDFNGIYHIKGHICTGPRGPKAAAPQSDADDWIVWWLKGE